jgi:O-antigen/teichoic acid export membrane protein
MSTDPTEQEKRNLDRTFVGGLGWTVGAKWATQLCTWASIMIVARILSPADFGTVDMAGYYVGLTSIIAEFGVGAAVLQMRELEGRALAEMNTVALLFSASVFSVSVALAPLVASFFHAGQVRMLLIVGSLSLFLSGIQAVPLALLQRDLDYRRLSISEVVMAVTQAGVTLACAVAGFGYWALLIGVLSGRAVYSVLISFWKPVRFAIPRWKEIATPLRFGFQVAISRLLWAAYDQSDAILVGRMLGSASLGSYRFAINVASIPAEKIGTLIMRVAGPLFARIQADHTSSRRYFLALTETLALMIFPLGFGIALVAPELVETVLGPKWSGAVGPMQLLAVFLSLRDLRALNSQILTSQRKTGFVLWIMIVNFLVMPPAFYFASRWGSTAIAATWLVTSPLTILPTAIKTLRTIHCKAREYLWVLAVPFLGSAAMAAAVLAVKAWLIPPAWPVAWRLIAEVASGGLMYAAVLLGPCRKTVVKYVRFFLQLRRDRNAALADLP